MTVQGKNVMVFIQEGSDWLPYLCARSATLNLSTEFIETSVSGSGTFATFLPTKNSFTGSLDGVVSMATPDVFELMSLRQKQIAQELLLMRYQRTDDAGNIYFDEASFYISGSSDSGSYDGMNLFSIELQGSGPLTQTFTPVADTTLRWWVVSVGINDNVYFYGTPVPGTTVHLALTATNLDAESPDYLIVGGDTLTAMRNGLNTAVNAGTLFTSTTFTTFTPVIGVTGLPFGTILQGLTIHNVAGSTVTTVVTVT